MRVIYCTTPLDMAEAVAETLVESRVAACVSIVPKVRSIYRWQGKVEREDEALLVIKTTEERTAAVIDRIRRVHPYDVPEAIALPIVEGLPEYLDWIAEQVTEE
jgi:periplasmic divalent cation tolerance protein